MEGFEYVLGSGFQKRTKKGASGDLVDFVLVCDVSALRNPEKLGYITKFVRNLEKRGLSVEFDVGVDLPDLVFIKICGKNALEKYAEAFNVNLSYQSYNYKLKPDLLFNFMTTELTRPNPNSEVYQRAEATCSRAQPTAILKIERIQIVYTLLMRTQFGDNVSSDYGVVNLLARGIIVSAYPLHDGTWMWNDNPSEPLNDRQLLMKYWGNMSTWYKQQPLDTIQYYFGADIAYYFAFHGFYNKMLIYASIAGIISFIASIIHSSIENSEILNDACSSNLILCPIFLTKNYVYRKLKDICSDIKLTYFFDSPLMIWYAVFMSFWATVFVCLWQKSHALLMYRWNISVDETYESRLEFEENTPYRRVCEITNEIEAYIPQHVLFQNYAITYGTCFTLIMIVTVVPIALIFMRVYLIPYFEESDIDFFKTNSDTASSLTSSMIAVIFIKIFTRVYVDISLWLTRRENPRTQEEFDSSFIYKSFLLAFVNNYSSIVYVAFLKGTFYTHPGDDLPQYKKDECHHGGCMLGLCIELTVHMLLKTMAENVFLMIQPVFVKWVENCYKYKHRNIATASPRQWEHEYNLCEIPEYFLVEQYLESIIQYGIVTCFVSAFPLGPLCAMINNLIKIKLDAYAFVRIYRRPVPNQGTRMAAFNNILKTMTFISTLSSAFVICFTSNYIKRAIYMYQVNWDMKGYIAYIHSEFAMKDFNAPDFTGELAKNHSDVICYYHAMRNPPDHQYKYQLSTRFWYHTAIRLITVIVFEHLVLMLNTILSRTIPPTVPHFVKKQVSYQRSQIKEETIKKIEGSK